ARPLAVVLTLMWSSLTGRERAFIAWSGLKGAVPILLAAFAILGGVRSADRAYGLVFVVVLLSVVVPGSLLPRAARELGVPIHEDRSDHPDASTLGGGPVPIPRQGRSGSRV